MVFGGLITIMLLGVLLDQIPDPAFAGLMELDPNDEAEKGQAKGVGNGKAQAPFDGSDVIPKDQTGTETSVPNATRDRSRS
jgi:hypothetical protein